MPKLMSVYAETKEHFGDLYNIPYTNLRNNYLIQTIKTEITPCSHREKSLKVL